MSKIQKVIAITAALLVLIFGISWFGSAGGIKTCNTDWEKEAAAVDPNSPTYGQPQPSCYFKPVPFWGDYHRGHIEGLIGAILTVTIPAGLLYLALGTKKKKTEN